MNRNYTRDGWRIVGWAQVDSGHFSVIDPAKVEAPAGLHPEWVKGYLEGVEELVGNLGVAIRYTGDYHLSDDDWFPITFDGIHSIRSGKLHYGGVPAFAEEIRTLYIVDTCYLDDRFDRFEGNPGLVTDTGFSTGGDGSFPLELSRDGKQLRWREDSGEEDFCEWYGTVGLEELARYPEPEFSKWRLGENRWDVSCRQFWMVEEAEPPSQPGERRRFCNLHSE